MDKYMDMYNEGPAPDWMSDIKCSIHDCAKTEDRTFRIAGYLSLCWPAYALFRDATDVTLEKVEDTKVRLLQTAAQYHHPDPDALLQLAEWIDAVPMAFSHDSPVILETCDEYADMVRRAFKPCKEAA